MTTYMTDHAPGPYLSVIVPIYNEAEGLAAFIDTLLPVVSSITQEWELLFVDDGSKDGSPRLIQSYIAKEPRIRLLVLSRNFGQEAALSAGLSQARGQAVITMDSDLQHPPALIRDMVSIWQNKKVQIVRAMKNGSGQQSLISRLGAPVLFPIIQRDTGLDLINSSNFLLLDRKVVDVLCALPENEFYLRGLSAWVGFEQENIYFRVPERAFGTSKWSPQKRIHLGIHYLIAFSTIPLHIITWLGLVTFCVVSVLGLQTLYKWSTGNAVEGFTTVILLILFIGSILMLSLGIIGQYMANIYQEVKARPRYIIKDRY